MTATYDTIETQLNTGDIVLFSGKDNISFGIQWFSDSKWSHIGMVLRLPQSDKPFLWESTTLSNMIDLNSGQKTEGVQRVFLRERVQSYPGEVAVRQLRVKRDFKMLAALSQFRQEVQGKAYETDKVQLIKSAYDGLYGENSKDLNSIFCSELLAEAYQRMGLLDLSLPSNEYAPRDFASEANLNLLKGTLEPELYINVARNN